MKGKTDIHANAPTEENANIDCNAIVFERVTDVKYVKIQKTLQWWSLNNVRLIVYSAFSLVIALFSIYYYTVADYFVATLALVSCLFMIYLSLSGANYFGTALAEDEQSEEKNVALKICGKELCIEIDGRTENFPVSSIKEVRIHDDKVYFRLKGSSLCPHGVTFKLNEKHKKSDLKKLAHKK